MSEVDVVAEILRAAMFPYLPKGLSGQEHVMALVHAKIAADLTYDDLAGVQPSQDLNVYPVNPTRRDGPQDVPGDHRWCSGRAARH